MFTTFFSWLRRRSEESILAGVNDAARKLGSDQTDKAPLVLLWQPPEESVTPEEEVKSGRRSRSA
jgi:hypothetical protein